MISVGSIKSKLYIGNQKLKQVYIGAQKIYSSGNIVTYICNGVTYKEEVEEGQTVLSPKTFVPTLSGWNFVGWRQDTTASGSVLISLDMDDSPITLYAVFSQTITLTTIANGSTTNNKGNRYNNNGNILNPKFTVTNPSKSGTTFKGWSKSTSSTVSYASISNLSLDADLTLRAVFQYPGGTASVYASGDGAYKVSNGWAFYHGTPSWGVAADIPSPTRTVTLSRSGSINTVVTNPSIGTMYGGTNSISGSMSGNLKIGVYSDPNTDYPVMSFSVSYSAEYSVG